MLTSMLSTLIEKLKETKELEKRAGEDIQALLYDCKRRRLDKGGFELKKKLGHSKVY